MNHEDGRREGGAQEIPPFSQGTRPSCLVTEARTFASRSGASARELGLAKVGRARRTAGRPAFAKATAASSHRGGATFLSRKAPPHWGCDIPLAQGERRSNFAPPNARDVPSFRALSRLLNVTKLLLCAHRIQPPNTCPPGGAGL